MSPGPLKSSGAQRANGPSADAVQEPYPPQALATSKLRLHLRKLHLDIHPQALATSKPPLLRCLSRTIILIPEETLGGR